MAEKSNVIITLNVGGTTFQTRKSTLMQFEDSMLASNISRWTPEDGEVYFLDLDPATFCLVLDYLRHNAIGYADKWLPPTDARTLSKLNLQLEYLGIPKIFGHSVMESHITDPEASSVWPPALLLDGLGDHLRDVIYGLSNEEFFVLFEDTFGIKLRRGINRWIVPDGIQECNSLAFIIFKLTEYLYKIDHREGYMITLKKKIA